MPARSLSSSIGWGVIISNLISSRSVGLRTERKRNRNREPLPFSKKLPRILTHWVLVLSPHTHPRVRARIGHGAIEQLIINQRGSKIKKPGGISPQSTGTSFSLLFPSWCSSDQPPPTTCQSHYLAASLGLTYPTSPCAFSQSQLVFHNHGVMWILLLALPTSYKKVMIIGLTHVSSYPVDNYTSQKNISFFPWLESRCTYHTR